MIDNQVEAIWNEKLSTNTDNKVYGRLQEDVNPGAKKAPTAHSPANATFKTECWNSVPLQTGTGALSNGWTYPLAKETSDKLNEQVCCDGIMSGEEGVACLELTLSDLQRLLGEVMDALDASIPNKQQHAATTRIVRKAFDKTYFSLVTFTFPDGAMGQSLAPYALEPIR